MAFISSFLNALWLPFHPPRNYFPFSIPCFYDGYFYIKGALQGIVRLTYVKEKPDGGSLYFFNHSVRGSRELLVLVTSCLGRATNGPRLWLLVVHVIHFKSGYGFSYSNYQTKALKRLSLATCMLKSRFLRVIMAQFFEAICNGWICYFVSWTIQQFVRVKNLSADWKRQEMWAHFSGSGPVANILFCLGKLNSIIELDQTSRALFFTRRKCFITSRDLGACSHGLFGFANSVILLLRSPIPLGVW